MGHNWKKKRAAAFTSESITVGRWTRATSIQICKASIGDIFISAIIHMLPSTELQQSPIFMCAAPSLFRKPFVADFSNDVK